MANDNSNEIQKYKEKKSTKWAFRFISLFSIIAVCIATIHIEFSLMKKDKNQKALAERLSVNFNEAMSSMQDSWNTMYYFYQTGDLFKILKCPNVNGGEEGEKDNMLLRLFREPYDATFKDDQLQPIQCGEDIDIVIGEKNDPYEKVINPKQYNIKLGNEPVEIIDKYPLVKFALNQLSIGEKATFISMLKKQKKLGMRTTKTYEITIKMKPKVNKLKAPTYIKLNNIDNIHSVSERSVCGSVITFFYNISDIEGNYITAMKKEGKAKIGTNTFNAGIETILKNAKVGDSFRIFMTKNYYQNDDEFLQQNPIIKSKDIIVVDVLVASVK